MLTILTIPVVCFIERQL